MKPLKVLTGFISIFFLACMFYIFLPTKNPLMDEEIVPNIDFTKEVVKVKIVNNNSSFDDFFDEILKVDYDKFICWFKDVTENLGIPYDKMGGLEVEEFTFLSMEHKQLLKEIENSFNNKKAQGKSYELIEFMSEKESLKTITHLFWYYDQKKKGYFSEDEYNKLTNRLKRFKDELESL